MKEYAIDPDDKKSGWVRKINKDFKKDGYTCKLWQKKNPEKGKSDWIRFETDMMNIDPKSILNYYRNPPKTANSPIKDMRVLEKIDENTEVLYMRFKIPMCSDRDNVLQNVVRNLEGDTQYFHLTTVEHKDMPPIKGVIRMFSQINGYVTKHPTIENCHKYTEIDYMDMKGNSQETPKHGTCRRIC
jgi:hypothetical protein